MWVNSLVWFMFAVFIYLRKGKDPAWNIYFSMAIICGTIWMAA